MHLDRFSLVSPGAPYSVAQAVRGAECWQLDTGAGRIVYALRQVDALLWIDAAAGATTSPKLAALLATIERRAAELGTVAVGFQTVRRGLVRAAKRLGYEIKTTLADGWVLGKAIDVPHQ